MSRDGLELTSHTEIWLIKNPVVQKYTKELMEINMSSMAKTAAKGLFTWRDPGRRVDTSLHTVGAREI